MEKENILKAALFAVFMLLHPIGFTYSQDSEPSDDPTPLCFPQIALANNACKKVRYTPAEREPSPPDDSDDDQPSPPDSDDDRPSSREEPNSDQLRRGRGRSRGRAMSMPPFPMPIGPLTRHGHRHGRHSGHRHGRHRRGHHHNRDGFDQSNDDDNDDDDDNDNEEECCRWLKQIDTECVCAVLLRTPVFLWKPEHDYTVTVGEQCNVTYECPPGLH